jgi:hypothetical protein
VYLLVKFTGKPDAGNPHVRFDEGEGTPLPTLLVNLVLKNPNRVNTLS